MHCSCLPPHSLAAAEHVHRAAGSSRLPRPQEQQVLVIVIDVTDGGHLVQRQSLEHRLQGERERGIVDQSFTKHIVSCKKEWCKFQLRSTLQL